MEATGVYWMHFYSMLDEKGFEVILANSRHVKHVKGRKTDVSDAEIVPIAESSFSLLPQNSQKEHLYLVNLSVNTLLLIRETSTDKDDDREAPRGVFHYVDGIFTATLLSTRG